MWSDDSRTRSRIRHKENVTIDKVIVARCANISTGGLFAYTNHSAKPGSLVELSFPVDDVVLNGYATVLHQHNDVGIGVMFLDQTEEQRTILDHFIKDKKISQTGDHVHTILLIDNNEAKRRLYKTALTQSGFSVLEAETDVQAFELLNSSRVDMVVFDPWVPPIGKGFMIINRIRRNREWRQIVPVVLSSRPLPPDKIKQFFPAVRHIFMKISTTPSRLQQIVDRHLAKMK